LRRRANVCETDACSAFGGASMPIVVVVRWAFVFTMAAFIGWLFVNYW
jgi:hypothetical protein